MSCAVVFLQHDTTVAMLLSCLGVFDGINPNYTSAVIVELYRADTSKLEVILMCDTTGLDLSIVLSGELIMSR